MTPPKDRRIRRNYTLRNINSIPELDRMGIFNSHVEENYHTVDGYDKYQNQGHNYNQKHVISQFQQHRQQEPFQQETSEVFHIEACDEGNQMQNHGIMINSITVDGSDSVRISQHPEQEQEQEQDLSSFYADRGGIYSLSRGIPNVFPYPPFDPTSSNINQKEKNKRKLNIDHNYYQDLPSVNTVTTSTPPEKRDLHFASNSSISFPYPFPSHEQNYINTSSSILLTFKEIAEGLLAPNLYQMIPEARILKSDSILVTLLGDSFQVEELVPPFQNRYSGSEEDKLIYSYMIIYEAVIIGIGSGTNKAMAEKRAAYNTLNYCGCFDVDHQRSIKEKSLFFFEHSIERINMLYRIIKKRLEIQWVNQYLWKVKPLKNIQRQLAISGYESSNYPIDERSHGILYGLSKPTMSAHFQKIHYIDCLKKVKDKFGENGRFIRILPDIFKRNITTVSYIFTYEYEKGKRAILSVGCGRNSETALRMCAMVVLYASPAMKSMKLDHLRTWEIGLQSTADGFYKVLSHLVASVAQQLLQRLVISSNFDNFRCSRNRRSSRTNDHK